MDSKTRVEVEVSRPCRRPHVEERRAGEDLVLYDPVGGRLHVLNATAATIWRMCDGSLPTPALAMRFRDDYVVGSDQDPIADVRAILGRFLDAGLIEDKGDLSPAGGTAPDRSEKLEVNPR